MLGSMTFRIVIDNGDDLPQVIRADLVEQVRALIDRYPRHQYVLSIEPGCWDMKRFGASVSAGSSTHLAVAHRALSALPRGSNGPPIWPTPW